MAAVADGMINIDLPGIDGANEDLFMTELFGGGDSSELQPNPSHNLFTQAPSQQQPQRLPSVEESILNRLLSAVYSGPTLGDIENALSVSTRKGDAAAAKDQFASSRPSFFSRGLSFGCSRMQDNKYTVRIKSSGATGGGMADDGYKWRKYGQKSIKNSPYPRSYYRCTNPRCNAKKQVERSADDPAVYVVTYEGLHLHYAYPQFFVPKLTARSTAGPTTDDLPVQKRPKIVNEEPPALRPAQRPIHGISKTQASLTTAQPDLTAASLSWKRQTGEEEKDRPSLAVEANRQQNRQQLGLLEDIVPLLVRNPVSTSTSTSTGYHSENQLLSSHPSPPRSPHLISSPTSSSSTSSSLTWSPTPTTAPSSYFDMVRMLSSAVPSNSTLNYPCN